MDKKFSERDIGLAKRYNIDLETTEILKNKQNILLLMITRQELYKAFLNANCMG